MSKGGADPDPVDFAVNAIEVLLHAAWMMISSVVVFLWKLVCLLLTGKDGTS